MTNVWFTTPAFRRIQLSAICFEQRRRMCEAMEVEAHAVVVANDENLELAREAGLEAVEHSNRYLGARFNAGYKYALEQGATHVMAIGSDSWMDPALFANLDWERRCFGNTRYSVFRADGNERIDMEIDIPGGPGVLTAYPAHALRHRNGSGHCQPMLSRGCDRSTWYRIGQGRLVAERIYAHPWELLAFQSYEVQITKYHTLKNRWVKPEDVYHGDIFAPLYEHYDADLVDQISAMYEDRRQRLSLVT